MKVAQKVYVSDRANKLVIKFSQERVITSISQSVEQLFYLTKHVSRITIVIFFIFVNCKYCLFVKITIILINDHINIVFKMTEENCERLVDMEDYESKCFEDNSEFFEQLKYRANSFFNMAKKKLGFSTEESDGGKVKKVR